MTQLVLFLGMTVSLVFLFTRHIQFKGIRERLTKRQFMNEEIGRKNLNTLFWCKFFTCDYCCGFWMSIVSFVCMIYCEPIAFLFTGALASFLILNKE